ncbi:uncharacterized protein LOC116956850 [Petromyzon marinus]|uniref:uncharacterized protein LOC116956850 n=1 Tax=Petromyzon marinus TaxID=7757 RepID=UPI003F724204
MNLPSCFIAFQSFATLILTSKSATISNVLREVIKDRCNETTHYLSRRGLCCEFCQAGRRKVMDCEPHSGTFCTSCEPGEDFTDEPNSSNECKKCTVCNVNFEKIVSRCTTRQDTRCRCRDGFQRAAPSDPCTDAKGDADVAVAIAGAAMLLILLVVTVGLLLYRFRHKRFPWERSRGAIRRNIHEEVLNLLRDNSQRSNISSHDELNQCAEDFIGQMIKADQEGNWKDVERELPELREWIGKTPSLFLHELKRRNVVTEEEYWKAFTIPDAAKRVDSILLPVMRRGEGKHRKLLETLEQQRSRERHFLDMLKTSHLCSPTLNPNSAHRQLQVSADLSTVTWNQAAQPYSDHAERFEWWPIVLCFETSWSGDHYWEVDVRASKNCYIGVASGSIPRNRQEKSGRLGWNEQSWALVQWDSNYSARHGDKCINYPEIQHLQRVGVRLDFNAGKLSFYNANTMELLHSFDDIPSGPLCPAMQVNSGSVAIYEAQALTSLTVDENREDIKIFHHFANRRVHRTKNTDAEKCDSKDALLRTRMEEPPVARELISRIPAMLHHELLVQGLITQSELSEVYSIPRASARADFIISHLDRKHEESPQLQEILCEHREKQEAFLKMRSESSTCSPTLNPNTAHRNLQISADFKTVRTSTHTQPYPDNSDRFDHYQVVICSEKFSSGRHYWEVDVRGSEKFNIGVTYDAIPRKGDDKACKIGCNEVSWSVRKWCNDYTAVHNGMVTNLSVRDAPKRVGVHLDWEAGVLSFYSADSMSLLHRFHGKFDRELYPAMAVQRRSLTICPLMYADARC